MDKTQKLRRYNRKDYTMVVDFPVEIVGRDGVVRRYSFEESIRLYQRRIASANVRYEDAEVAKAEVVHCKQRIDQLRRSYFARYGWANLQHVRGTRMLDDSTAGEIAAFLRRCLDGSDRDPEALRLTSLDGGSDVQLFYIQAASAGQSASDGDRFLLYLYRFEEPGDCPSREGFFQYLKVLKGVQHAPEGVEALVAFHHTVDCGLILTARKEDLVLLAHAPSTDEGLPPDLSWMEMPMKRDALREAHALLRKDRVSESFEAFLVAMEENPYRRVAYLGAATLGDVLGDHAEAETAALMGTRTFPGDPGLWYHLGLARLRQGDMEGTALAVAEAENLEGPTQGSRLMAALVAFRRGRITRARQCLRAAAREEVGREPTMQLTARRLNRASLLWLSGRAAGALGVGIGLAFLTRAPLLTALQVGFSVALFGLSELAWRRWLAGALTRPSELPLARLTALQRAAEPLAADAQ